MDEGLTGGAPGGVEGGEEPEEEGNDQSLEEDEQAWSNGEGETFIAECVGLPVEEEVGGEDPEGSTQQAEEESFGSNENGNPEPGESEGLKDRGLLDAATHNQEYGIGNQPEDGGHRAQTKPAGETDDFNHLLGCFREKGLLGTGDRWLGIGSKGVIDSLGDLIEKISGGHLDIELGDGSEAHSRGLLQEGQVDVGDIVVLAFSRLDDAGDVDIDSDGLELVTGPEATALGEGLAHESGVGAPGPFLKGACDDVQVGIVAAQALGGNAPEGNDIETGTAVVDHDLDGNCLPHALDTPDRGEVVLRETGGSGAEAVFPVDDESGVVRTGPRDASERVLHGFHRGEEEHSGRYPGHGQHGAEGIAEDVLEGE